MCATMKTCCSKRSVSRHREERGEAKRMENRKWRPGNGKPANASHIRIDERPIFHSRFPVSSFLVSILLVAAVDGAGGWHAASAVPAETPAAAAPGQTPAPPRAPKGFGKAKFGMTLEQVRQLYPTLAPAPVVTSAAYFRSPNLTRYWMTKVDVPGLHGPCSVEFRFWKSQLWSVVVYYGAIAFTDVVEHLQRDFGPPSTKGRDPSWALGTATITTSPGQRWYSFEDSEISKDVRGAFLAAVQQRQPGKTPRTPAAAPPGGQPPGGQGTPGL